MTDGAACGEYGIAGDTLNCALNSSSSSSSLRKRVLVSPLAAERARTALLVRVQVRQKGREALQQALYERAQGRYKARTFGHMAANLCGLLMLDLSEVHGKKVPYASMGEMQVTDTL